MKRWRIGFVVQRYGANINGGAETLARVLAEKLGSIADVEVITTCATDYMTWANEFAAGTETINGVTVHRFPVDRARDWTRFQRDTFALLNRERSIADEVAWVRQQGPYSTPLIQFIDQNSARFDAFFFIPYLYATTYFGLSMVAEKAILIPAAHDEPYLEMPVFAPQFRHAAGLSFSTVAERDMVHQRMGNGDRPHIVAGIGVESPTDIDAARFRQKYGVEGPFALYAGRISESKNVPELLAQFAAWQAESNRPVQLLLMGKAHIPLPNHPAIRHLGFVSEADKFDGLAAADMLILPSKFESLSIIALEAWLTGTPVVVNGHCDVMKSQIQLSNGGLYYSNAWDFARIAGRLFDDRALAQTLGAQGRAFVLAQYNWDHIIAKYAALLRVCFGEPAGV